MRHCAYCGTWIGGTGEVCKDCSDLPRAERMSGALELPVCPDCGDYVEAGPTCPTCGAGIFAKSGKIVRRATNGRWLRVV